FANIDSHAEAEKVLLQEFTQTLYTVAEDVYLNVKFNPDYVKEYRVLGFDNKVGALKDTASIVEGGEVGSAYSMQVVFEVVPAPAKIGDSLRRPAVLSLHYKLPNDTTRYTEVAQPELYFQPLLQAPPYYRFAASVMLFGSLLRESAYVKEVDWNQLLQLAAGAINPEDKSQKEFLMLVQQARNIYAKGKRLRFRNSER
ncbi:MAG: YfbK domain-containing protein, partial [Chitinophagaceae bacterium]